MFEFNDKLFAIHENSVIVKTIDGIKEVSFNEMFGKVPEVKAACSNEHSVILFHGCCW